MQELDFYVKDPLTVFECALSRTPVDTKHKAFLKNAYLHYGRYYHNIFHLSQMLRLHYRISKLFDINFSYNEEVKLVSAIVYHDVVYDPMRKDNEEKSALLWETHRKESGKYILANEETLIVSKMIRQSADHFASREYNEINPEDNLREWFIGLDLASLASPINMFEMNNMAIRAEYSHVSNELWKTTMGDFIEIVKNTKQIYLHPIMYELFESKARDNIKFLKQFLEQ